MLKQELFCQGAVVYMVGGEPQVQRDTQADLGFKSIVLNETESNRKLNIHANNTSERGLAIIYKSGDVF